MKRRRPTLQPEREAWAEGFLRVAGVDEAGRGPLAGPVVAAAVLMDRSLLESDLHGVFPGLTDSKQLSAARRAVLFDLIAGHGSVRQGIGQATVEEIDRINILRATHVAMRRALEALGPCDMALVDGLPVPGLPVASRALVGGDARSFSIAAASILAKVTRDRLMDDLDRRYPCYGFARHRGYGTAAHLQALRIHGPCPEHRRSFAPVAQLSLPLRDMEE